VAESASYHARAQLAEGTKRAGRRTSRMEETEEAIASEPTDAEGTPLLFGGLDVEGLSFFSADFESFDAFCRC
jgi:hypothetical protein